MSTALKAAKMSAMEPDTALHVRGQALKEWANERRGRIAQLMRHSGIKSNDTVYAAFRGQSSIETMEKLEEARREIDGNSADADVPTGTYAARNDADQIIEFEVSADAVGVRVFVRGPIALGDDLSAQAAKVFREIQKQLPEGDLGTKD